MLLRGQGSARVWELVNDEIHVVVVVVVRPRFDHESSRERENFVKDEFDCDNPT
jgi:hypothetical protein